MELRSSDGANLTMLRSYTTGKRVESSPTISHGTVYVGSIDGYEYALNASTGALLWRYCGGLSSPSNCSALGNGIVSSATEWNGTVYVGGGDGYWDAINSTTGELDWDVYIGNASHGFYNWASPLLVDGYAYIGVSSQCDSPLVLAGLLKVSLSPPHASVFFQTTPNGTVGSSIWGSPAYNAATNTVFAATGNPKGLPATPYSESMLAWNATNLTLLGHWQVPANQTGIDADLGATPDLVPLANGTLLAVATNKNGITYALNASNLDAGPIWETQISFLIPCPASLCADQPPNVAPVTYGGGCSTRGVPTPRSEGSTTRARSAPSIRRTEA
ncbi:MAG: PQQ-binding-like beta-propeller repeat protein [Thermoplasmata archaeon]